MPLVASLSEGSQLLCSWFMTVIMIGMVGLDVLSQQILAIVIAIWCSQDSVDMIS